jgi:hypothetical protein
MPDDAPDVEWPEASVGAGSLCSSFVHALYVSGASISVFDLAGRQSTICASGPLAARAETVQFELGEGPHWEALRTDAPVLCPDLSGPAQSWPMFATAVQELGIRAVFAFPMKLGAATVGAVDLYCLTPRRLDVHQVSLASSMANRIAIRAVRIAMSGAEDHTFTENEHTPSLRREVHQATGMIQAQLDVTATEAFARLRGHAFVAGVPVESVAADVVGGQINFAMLDD